MRGDRGGGDRPLRVRHLIGHRYGRCPRGEAGRGSERDYAGGRVDGVGTVGRRK